MLDGRQEFLRAPTHKRTAAADLEDGSVRKGITRFVDQRIGAHPDAPRADQFLRFSATVTIPSRHQENVGTGFHAGNMACRG
jgi:hypothetical protein